MKATWADRVDDLVMVATPNHGSELGFREATLAPGHDPWDGLAADMRPGSGIFEVQSERGRDVRREIAREIVTRGWGLLELRPMRISLEEVFLQVTTEETPEAPPGNGAAPDRGPALSEGGARAEGERDARVEGEAPRA